MAAKKRATTTKGVREAASSAYSASPAIIEIGAGAFKDQCLQLLDRVKAGDTELLVTKHGVPVARVVAPDFAPGKSRGFMRGTILKQGDIVSADHDAWGDSNE